MTKWAFLFCSCMLLASVSVVAQAGGGSADTLEVAFGWMGGRSGDTTYLYMPAPEGNWPVSPAYFERYYNKFLRVIYHGDTMVTGTVIVWFVIDSRGLCTMSYCDSTVSEPELADEVLRVTNHMNALRTITPSRIRGEPVVSRVKMRVAYQFAGDGETPLPPKGPRPDIIVVGYSVQH